MVCLLAVAAGGKAILFDTLDPDCFWHLRVAEQLCAEGIHPLVDHLSYSSIQEPWSPYSWLAELGMKSIWDAGGFRLALLTQAAMQAAFVVLLALCCRRAQPALPAGARFVPPIETAARCKEARPSYLACCVSAAAMTFISLPYLSFRPVTASLVLLAACMLLVIRDRACDERTRLVWLVPLLTAITVNIHLNAVFVPAGLGVLLIAAVWERLVTARPPERGEASRRIARVFLLTAVSAAACCCTPMLPGMVRTALHYGSTDPMVAGGYIAEMRPFFLGMMGKVSAAIVGLALLLFLCRMRSFRVGERLCLAAAVVLLSQWGRFAPVFAIAAAPVIAVALGRMLSDRVLARLPARLAMVAVLVVAIVRIGGEFPGSNVTLAHWTNRHGADAPGYPHEAAHYVAAQVNPRNGRLISEFDWGGYLEWSLGDRYQLLLDGRTQLFTPASWRATYLDGDDERARVLSTTEADAAILPAGRSMFRHTLVRQGWRVVWKDERSEVLLPPEKTVQEPAIIASEPVPAKAKRWPLFSAILPD